MTTEEFFSTRKNHFYLNKTDILNFMKERPENERVELKNFVAEGNKDFSAIRNWFWHKYAPTPASKQKVSTTQIFIDDIMNL